MSDNGLTEEQRVFIRSLGDRLDHLENGFSQRLNRTEAVLGKMDGTVDWLKGERSATLANLSELCLCCVRLERKVDAMRHELESMNDG